VPPDLDDPKVSFSGGLYRYTTHALERMPERGIRIIEIEEVIGRDAPEVIEDYPLHALGPCCLVLGWADLARPLRIVVGYPGYEVVTVYEPDTAGWAEYRRRVA
jgi:hypothetical protein